jgi:E3 ubiquitin-protein ligase UHRF1
MSTSDVQQASKEDIREQQNTNVVKYAQAVEEEDGEDVLENLKCSICFDLCRKPISLPCQHNMCLKCFNDMNARSTKHTCPSCRSVFGRKFAENPRINTAMTMAIRAIRAGKTKAAVAPAHAAQMLRNEDRPDEAYTTERAQRTGRANAASGRIMVTVPNDHFGPIGPEHDPIRNTGVLVGEYWKDRLDCRQWGAHFPHVAGIAGQSSRGAQSVVLSGGYIDDYDGGDWFLYTGSGGRDLSGNKRTCKVQSFDQTFDNMNLALKVSCEKGLPVRVVRSHKERRSVFAPNVDNPVRYDGIYRIAKCWRKTGEQGLLMCRYLFIRCDNAPAPWDESIDGNEKWTLKSLESNPPKGDWSRALKEMKNAKGKVYQMCDKPYWDFIEEEGMWGWAKPQPESQKLIGASRSTGTKKRVSEAERALREMTCGLCKEVMVQPVTTPCDHSFCRPCLESKFGQQGFEVNPKEKSHGRSLRIRTTIMECPNRLCNYNIASFLRSCQVNRDMENIIASLQKEVAAAKEKEAQENTSETTNSCGNNDSGDESGKKENTMNNSNNNGKPLPEAWQKTMHAEKQRAEDRVTQLFDDFKEDFDHDLIQSLLEQEEGDVKVVSVALQRMRDDLQKANIPEPVDSTKRKRRRVSVS